MEGRKRPKGLMYLPDLVTDLCSECAQCEMQQDRDYNAVMLRCTSCRAATLDPTTLVDVDNPTRVIKRRRNIVKVRSKYVQVTGVDNKNSSLARMMTDESVTWPGWKCPKKRYLF